MRAEEIPNWHPVSAASERKAINKTSIPMMSDYALCLMREKCCAHLSQHGKSYAVLLYLLQFHFEFVFLIFTAFSTAVFLRCLVHEACYRNVKIGNEFLASGRVRKTAKVFGRMQDSSILLKTPKFWMLFSSEFKIKPLIQSWRFSYFLISWKSYKMLEKYYNIFKLFKSQKNSLVPLIIQTTRSRQTFWPHFDLISSQNFPISLLEYLINSR